MINYNGNCEDLANLIARHNSYETVADIEGHPTPGSLGDYAPEVYSCPVITYECPLLDDRYTLESIWEENKAGLVALIQSALLKRKVS